MEVLQTTAEGDRCAVRWRLTGTFAGPGGGRGSCRPAARLELEGCDVVQVARRARGRQRGVRRRHDDRAAARRAAAARLAAPSAARRRCTNLRTRLVRRFAAGDPEQIADGVWVVRGGFPRSAMNVYFVRDGDGVRVMFDAGMRAMTPALAAIGAQLGGITRIVLGHGHADHRGAAPGLGAPVWCHPDERRRRGGRRRRALLRPRDARRARAAAAGTAAADLGRRAGRDRRHGRRRATRSPASASSTCPATRPG